MSLYAETIPQFQKMLNNLDTWLGLGVEYAGKKKFDPAVLLNSRLAPDQYPLLRQIQAACDQAKAAAARLTGQEPPKHPDTEVTLEEIKARIQTVRTYLSGFSEKDFVGAETRLIGLPFAPGKGMIGSDYTQEMALPNFYFHVAMAYAILRHNGVDLGKSHFISGLTLRDM